MALSCRTLSLVGHLLIDRSFGAAIRIDYSDLDGRGEDDQDSVRHVA